MKKLDWEQDILNRQRNIVFPDTVLNEGRFYRNIFSRDAYFTPGQRIGLVMFGIFNLTLGLVGLFSGSLISMGIFGLMIIFGLGMIVRAIVPSKPSRLTRLRGYRRPRIR